MTTIQVSTETYQKLQQIKHQQEKNKIKSISYNEIIDTLIKKKSAKHKKQ